MSSRDREVSNVAEADPRKVMKVHRILTPGDDARSFPRPELLRARSFSLHVGQLPRTDGARTEQNVDPGKNEMSLWSMTPYPQYEVWIKRREQIECIELTSANCIVGEKDAHPPSKTGTDFAHLLHP